MSPTFAIPICAAAQRAGFVRNGPPGQAVGDVSYLVASATFCRAASSTAALRMISRAFLRSLAFRAAAQSLKVCSFTTRTAIGRPGVVVTILCDGADKYLSEHFWDDQD